MRRAGFVLALLLLARPIAAAKRPRAEQEKIDWLLSEVERSGAVFLRNGAEYPAAKAASHLRTKLYFAGKRVQTAREFILGVCSRSEETGKPYEIRLKDGARRLVGDWLTERLERFEKRTPARAPSDQGSRRQTPRPIGFPLASNLIS